MNNSNRLLVIILVLLLPFFWWQFVPIAFKTISLLALIGYLFLIYFNRFPFLRLFLLIILFFFLSWGILFSLALANSPASDVVVSMEVATRALLSGQNPYAMDFHSSPLLNATASINEPGWIAKGQDSYLLYTHFPYTPAIFLVTIPFSLAFPTLSFYWICFLLLWILFFFILLMIKDPFLREGMLLFIFLNPFILFSVLLGHVADFLGLVLLLHFVFFVFRHRFFLAGLTLGLLVLTKLYFLLLVPFLLVYFFEARQKGLFRGLLVSMFMMSLPFLVWDPLPFLDDTILIYLRSGPGNLVIWKDTVGIFPLLASIGIISPQLEWVPTLTMLTVFILIFVFFLRQKNHSFSHALAYSTLASTAVLFFSKFFSFNYLSLPFTLLAGLLLWKILHAQPSQSLFSIPN
ncbi:MAG: DUF2029 domain-containing protein [Candidatus Diapherotrites archaeon]|uniref:DUF2029 domain-containing protein n=1 Tax=Candidatus Iainarchaeum sp. TaxID=3101447 RepID=A0A8T4CC31_9ARCH|nr:DUF2029 domain-containing protein [Candidatus Diapherotrites archaeon]